MNAVGDSVPGGRPRLSRWLVAVTGVSFAIFLTGLGLLLFGPRAERLVAKVTKPLADAAPVVVAPPPADAQTMVETAKPAPEGMLLVPAGNGAKVAFYVDRAPVTNAEYAQFRVQHKYARKDADRPVTGVPYDYAVEYARFRKKRLLREGEWDAAVATASFVPAGMKLVEWIDDGSGKAGSAADRAVRGVNGKAARKPPAGDASTTFRLALDAAP